MYPGAYAPLPQQQQQQQQPGSAASVVAGAMRAEDLEREFKASSNRTA
jgi:hypothetical protein